MSETAYKTVKTKFDPDELKRKYPNSIPIILKKASSSTLPDISECKLLMKDTCSVCDLYKLVRTQMDLSPEVALFFFVGNTIPSTTATLGDLYRDYQMDDGILYITFTDESVYGRN